MNEQLKEILKKHNQEHLIKGYERLDDEKKKLFLMDLENIDFDFIESLFNKPLQTEENDEISPIDYYDKDNLENYTYYENIGKEAIKDGKLAVVTMAGGQGTRLGHDGPKGTYDIGLDSHKSLFELLCDTLKEAQNKYNVTVPWYIMTSKENNQQTIEFFEKNNYFNYPKIEFFIQEVLPMVDDKDGKIIINENGLIKMAANGHGGIYESLVKNKITDEMKKNGNKFVFIGGVDNCLLNMVDPILMGLTIDKNLPLASKSVVKSSPEENTGVFCKRNGKPSIIEYTEITKEMANARKNGELLYGEANILSHLFTIEFIEKISDKKLPYHIAHKKTNYIDEEGNIIKPEKPNAYKFESFIFDAFKEADDMVVLRVKRENEFAPVKNNDSAGVDCPKTAKVLYKKFHNIK